jgi:hypothetical protein
LRPRETACTIEAIDTPDEDTRTILWLLADILDEVRRIRLLLEDEDDEEDDDA